MSGPRYSQAGMQALKHGVAAFRAGDRIVPARQARNLLEAVEALPPRHDCAGVRDCEDHPKWRVLLERWLDGTWYSIPPGPETFPVPDEHRHASLSAAHTLATERAHAAQLAAITHSEGIDALPADLETHHA